MGKKHRFSKGHSPARDPPAMDDRAEHSPYTSGAAVLIVGADEVLYTILESSLEKYPALVARRYYYDNAQVKLPNADSDVAHTLAHYVSTGEYQTLKTWDDSMEETYATEHRRGLQAYCASRHYQLDGLDDLAKDKVTSLSDSIPVLTALGHIKAAFTATPDDDWLPAYLDHMLERAFETDEAVFTTDELADHVGAEPTFDQALVRSLGRLLRDVLSPPDDTATWDEEEAVPISLGEDGPEEEAPPWQNGAASADASGSEHGDWETAPAPEEEPTPAPEDEPAYLPVDEPVPIEAEEHAPAAPEEEKPADSPPAEPQRSTEGYSPIPDDLDDVERPSPPPPAPEPPAESIAAEPEPVAESYPAVPDEEEEEKSSDDENPMAGHLKELEELEKLEPRSYQLPARSSAYRSVATR